MKLSLRTVIESIRSIDAEMHTVIASAKNGDLKELDPNDQQLLADLDLAANELKELYLNMSKEKNFVEQIPYEQLIKRNQ